MIASFASKIFMLRDSITKSVLFGVGANLASLYQADFNERKEVGIFDLAKKVVIEKSRVGNEASQSYPYFLTFLQVFGTCSI